VRGLLRETEAGVRALQRSRQWREAARASQGQALPQAVRDQLSFPVALPSPFLRASVRGFHVRARAALTPRAPEGRPCPDRLAVRARRGRGLRARARACCLPACPLSKSMWAWLAVRPQALASAERTRVQAGSRPLQRPDPIP